MRLRTKRPLYAGILILVILSVLLAGCGLDNSFEKSPENVKDDDKGVISFSYNIDLEDISEFDGSPYVKINNNIPYFDDKDYTTQAFEYYSELDDLGRGKMAYANICKEIMPVEERSAIGMIKPSGWQTIKYDFVDGKYLYNRCHLIGYQLSGENDNVKNLITGTRYMNVEGMLPFENMVNDYVDSTNNHVLYRVTPIYEGDNLLASGVQMEGWSVEDNGQGICFNVFVYNCQPGVIINYANGESIIDEQYNDFESKDTDFGQCYIINTNTKKFHNEECGSVDKISEGNRITYYGKREEIISQGFIPCGNCKP